MHEVSNLHLDTSHLGVIMASERRHCGYRDILIPSEIHVWFLFLPPGFWLGLPKPLQPTPSLFSEKNYSDIYYCLLQFIIWIYMEYDLMFQYMHILYIDQIKVASLSTTYPWHFFVVRTSALSSSCFEMYHALWQSSTKTFVIYWVIRTCDTDLLNPLEFLGWVKHLGFG